MGMHPALFQWAQTGTSHPFEDPSIHTHRYPSIPIEYRIHTTFNSGRHNHDQQKTTIAIDSRETLFSSFLRNSMAQPSTFVAVGREWRERSFLRGGGSSSSEQGAILHHQQLTRQSTGRRVCSRELEGQIRAFEVVMTRTNHSLQLDRWLGRPHLRMDLLLVLAEPIVHRFHTRPAARFSSVGQRSRYCLCR